MDVYAACPTFGNELIALRPLAADDAEELLKCYSDPLSAPFFNDDNCSGGFRFATLEEMRKTIDVWLWCYQTRQFVRWTIEDQATGRAIGTVEMFHAEGDRASAYGVLRVDVRSMYETRAYLWAIFSLCAERFFEAFDVREIVTKAWPDAVERRAALEALGFLPTTLRTHEHYMSLTNA